MGVLQAAIFDLDGLLVDSEPLWVVAEIEVFGRVGIQLDAEICLETVGIGLEGVVDFRFEQHPWRGKTKAEVAEEIHSRMIELLREDGQPMPGAIPAIEFVRARGLKVGLATASDHRLIDAMLDALGGSELFDHIQSASELSHQKPHPMVYLVCAQALRVSPERCLAFEDSIPGLISAKSAGMRVVAVPDPAIACQSALARADLVLGSLSELDEQKWRSLNSS